MDFLSSIGLTSLYNNIDIFLIILIRILGFSLLIPVFSGTNIPNTTKIGFAVIVSVIVYSTGVVDNIFYYDTVIGYIFLILKEFVVGLVIAFMAYVVFSTMYFIGMIIDFMLGLSMLSVFDPVSKIQVPITGNLYYFAISLMLIQAGGLNVFFSVIIRSFQILKIGTASIINIGALLEFLLILINETFVMGIKFSIPLLGAILMVDITLGILVKAVPKINVFVIGAPLKIFVGLLILISIVPIFTNLYEYVFNSSLKSMMEVIKGMSPR